jgi:hypothetical protein
MSIPEITEDAEEESDRGDGEQCRAHYYHSLLGSWYSAHGITGVADLSYDVGHANVPSNLAGISMHSVAEKRKQVDSSLKFTIHPLYASVSLPAPATHPVDTVKIVFKAKTKVCESTFT